MQDIDTYLRVRRSLARVRVSVLDGTASAFCKADASFSAQKYWQNRWVMDTIEGQGCDTGAQFVFYGYRSAYTEIGEKADREAYTGHLPIRLLFAMRREFA